MRARRRMYARVTRCRPVPDTVRTLFAPDMTPQRRPRAGAGRARKIGEHREQIEQVATGDSLDQLQPARIGNAADAALDRCRADVRCRRFHGWRTRRNDPHATLRRRQCRRMRGGRNGEGSSRNLLRHASAPGGTRIIHDEHAARPPSSPRGDTTGTGSEFASVRRCGLRARTKEARCHHVA